MSGPEPQVVWRWSPIQPGAMERLDQDGVWRMILEYCHTSTPPTLLFHQLPAGSKSL